MSKFTIKIDHISKTYIDLITLISTVQSENSIIFNFLIIHKRVKGGMFEWIFKYFDSRKYK